MITKILWSLIGISVIAVALIGTKVILPIIGIIVLVFGSLSVFSKKFDSFMHRHFPESASDKKLFPAKFLYWNRRYFSGVGLIIVGIFAILFYYIIS